MMLTAAVVPPSATQLELAKSLRAATDDVPTPTPQPEVRKRSFLRLGSSAVPTTSQPATIEDVLRFVEPEDMRVLIAQFGNLTTDQAFRLAAAIGEAAPSWPRAAVRIRGATILDSADGRSIWAEFDGDVTELIEIARGVSGIARRLGFRFDRRRFQPRIHVATLRQESAAADAAAAAVVAALDRFDCEPWVVDHVSLLKKVFHAQGAETVEAARIAIG